MKLAALATKPKLNKIVIDDDVIVERYGEALEFWVYDRQSMETYMALSQMQNSSVDDIANAVLPLVMDESGKPALDPSEHLPLDVTVKVIEKVTVSLGNLLNQTTAA